MMMLDKLIEKSFFPKVKSVYFELRKAGLLRILLGIIIFIRFFEITKSYQFFYGYYSTISLVTVFLIIMFTIGFFTPVVTFLLIIFVRLFDSKTGTNTLGTTIMLHSLFAFLLMNSGAFFSIDSLLLKKKGYLANCLNSTYKIIGFHSNETLTKLYFCVFVLYAVISCGALAIHLDDPYWYDGLTIKSLMSNSYLSSCYEGFRWLENTYPKLVSILSFSGLILQSIFQLLMLPFLFLRLGVFFVKWWGIAFFVISLFVINLSYLPHVELILWGLILFPVAKLSVEKEKRSVNVYNELLSPFSFNKKRVNIVYKLFSIIILLFIMVNYPIVGKVTNKLLGEKVCTHINDLTYQFGLEIPHVFNKTDLSMGDNWMMIYRYNDLGRWEKLPISDEDGSRLNYINFDILNFSNHNSDFLYFGTSLQYRRAILKATDIEKFHSTGFGYQSLLKRIKYDYKILELTGGVKYKVKVYNTNSSKAIHWESNNERHLKKVIFEGSYIFNGKELLNEDTFQ